MKRNVLCVAIYWALRDKTGWISERVGRDHG
jgi:hypothetical protein